MNKKFNILKLSRFCVLALIMALLSGCVSRGSQQINYENICDIFSSKKRWYRAAQKSTKQWGGNIELPMAIIYQESTFDRNARPKRKRILGFIPGARPSNSYGYSQALKSTWQQYQDQTGRHRTRRDNFAHAFDFVHWYINRSYTLNGVSKWDYSNQYLNYHEGHGGFQRKTHLNKNWLLKTASRVKARAERYKNQLNSCQHRLK